MLFNRYAMPDEEKNIQIGDVFDQLQFIVTTLIKREVPSIDSTSRLLYHTNLKILHYSKAAEYHRKHIDLNTSLGTYHQECYELAIKKRNQLQRLMDSFILLNIEEERKRINHRMRFVDDKIEKLYAELQNHHQKIPESEEAFWTAMKEDIMPILSQLD